MKFFFTAFGIHNKNIVTHLPDHAIFPLSKETDDGLDLDYTALMLGTEFAIDKTAYEYVLSGEKQFLAPMAHTLKFLKQEGLLSIIDFGSVVSQNQSKIDAKVEGMLNETITWFRIAQRQWESLRAEFSEFHREYGDKVNKKWNEEHFGIINHLELVGAINDAQELEAANKLFSSKRKSYSNIEIDKIQSIIKPLLTQILINDLIRTKYGQPFLDWDDAKEYYERLYYLRWDEIPDDIELHKQARILFDAVIPDLKPANIEEVVRFIREDKAVESMRGELLESLQSGEGVSKEFFLRYSNKVIQRELNIKRKMKKYRLVGSGITSIIPGGGFIQEAAIAAAENKIEDAIETSKTRSSMEWFYALQKEAARRNL